ncbi:MAG: TspO/MBR family protein [Syntrophomonadaceae bacterium]|nr:TspO/MBR family protein [Syntrophomonadaceae bacterium]
MGDEMMKNGAWKTYVLFIALTEAVGALAGWLTRNGVEAYNGVLKSALTPPNMVFPIVWAILFALLGFGTARIWLAAPSPERWRGLLIFWVQLGFNFAWSLLFFNLQAFGFAFLWLIILWVLILLMIMSYHRVDKTAAWLQLPYLIWVTFAGYLNCVTWLLNR